MKRIVLAFLFLASIFACSSCGKEDDQDNNVKENQIMAKIDGRDTVFTIDKVILDSFNGYKQLSIITVLSGNVLDFYLRASEITTMEYPFHTHLTMNPPTVFAYGYYRATSGIYYSSVTDPSYKAVITEISGNKVKGTLKFLATGSTNKLIEGTFSSNLLEIR